jgi:K+-transporting ATPase ATPase C chain
MKIIFKSTFFVLLFTALLGFIYPFLVTIIGHALFPKEVNGSIIYNADGKIIGSELIGQYFTDKKYFWGRHSATINSPYNSLASGGSNLGPTNEKLLIAIKNNIRKLIDSGLTSPIPPDLVSASAAGLDPHISLKSAMLQIPRISKERKLNPERLGFLLKRTMEKKQFGLFGAERVNVFKLNVELDRIKDNE